MKDLPATLFILYARNDTGAGMTGERIVSVLGDAFFVSLQYREHKNKKLK